MTVFPVENISQKVILAKDEDVAARPSYLVVDYMRHIFSSDTRNCCCSILPLCK